MSIRRAGPRLKIGLIVGLLIVGGGAWFLFQDQERPLPALKILCQDAPDCRLTALIRMRNAPFPFSPTVGEAPFFADPGGLFSGRRRVVRRGLSYSEKAHYWDDRVLVHIPPGFDATKPFAILLYFHGHQATLEETVLGERQIVGQVTEAGRNLILIAPQFARNAIDSHPGKLNRSGAASLLIAETMDELRARFPKLAITGKGIKEAPLIVAAFSGGWWPAAATVARGVPERGVAAVILLDTFFGAEKVFAAWLAVDPAKHLLVGLHSKSSVEGVERLHRLLVDSNRKVARRLPKRLELGSVTILGVETAHLRLPVQGPPALPLAELLRRLPAWPRLKPKPSETGRTDLPPLKP